MSDPAVPPSSDPGDQQTFLFERPLLPAGLTARYDVTGRLGAGGMGVEDAKRALASRFALSLEEPGLVLTYLSTRRIYGFSGYWDSYPAKIMEVSAEEVQRVAQKYINPDALVIVAVGDRQKIEPALARFGTVELFDTEGRQIK